MRARSSDLCARALKAARSAGAGEAAALLSERRDGHLRFADNGPTTSAEVQRNTLALSAAMGMRHASGSTEDLSPAGVARLAQDVVARARLTPEDPEYVPEAPPQSYLRVPSFDAEAASMDPRKRAALVKPVLDAAVQSGLIAAGLLRNDLVEETRLSTAGSSGARKATRVELSATLRRRDGSASGWAGAAGVRLSDVDPQKIASRAAQKATAWREPRELPPGAYTVVLEAGALGALFPSLRMSLDARSAEEGRSGFSAPGGKSRVGEALFSPAVTLVSDPQDPLVPGTPWSEGGLAARRVSYVQAGVLRELHRSRYWAKKTGAAPTADGGTLRLVGGGLSLEDLIAKVDRGLLVTRIWYVRMLDPQRIGVTGLTRDATFLIEGGRVAAAVKNFRFNQSLLDLLRDVVALGREEVALGGELAGGVALAPAVVKDFQMSSVSEAV
jgi:predicted Zn-dependent protease